MTELNEFFQAPVDSPARNLYESGVRFGCWGMSMYSLSCACYSTVIEKLIQKFGYVDPFFTAPFYNSRSNSAKRVYVGGLVTYSVGMLMMALIRNRAGVIIFSGTAGVMYSTLFTMPYLIVAHYHAKGMVSGFLQFEYFQFRLKLGSHESGTYDSFKHIFGILIKFLIQ